MKVQMVRVVAADAVSVSIPSAMMATRSRARVFFMFEPSS